jgi:hypothetical protein
MKDNLDRFWDTISDELRGALHLRPWDAEQAERECEEAPDAPLSSDQINAIITAIDAGHTQLDTYQNASPLETLAASELEEEVCVLNRNAGEKNVEVQSRIDSLRRKALEDNGQNESKD